MLKIYLKTTRHKIESKHGDCTAYHRSRYVIEDESAARSSTKELSIYDNRIKSIGYWYMMCEHRKGIKVLMDTSDGLLTFKQWKDPDARLVEIINYKEQSCSMKQLFELDADKVIAYLKQEGIALTVSS